LYILYIYKLWSLRWYHKLAKCATSCAHVSKYCYNRSGGGVSIRPSRNV